MIIIISSEKDEHTRVVIQRLNKEKARVSVLDLSDFPQKIELTLAYYGQTKQSCSKLSGDKIAWNFADCTVIWWRRPQPFVLHSELESPTDRDFAHTECYSAFSGLWLTLDALWINHPTKDEEAARKAYQLKIAQECGFRVPTTCITNSPKQARRFINQNGVDSTVYKAFSGTRQAWRETRILKSNEIELIENVKYAPVIFQEYIKARVDLRVTIIGKRIFAAAIHSQQTSYNVDFRMAMADAYVEAFDLPKHIVDLLHKYMARLGLVYGAIDMRLTPEGQYVFLEINPAGQWLFIEHRTGQPITESLVELMLSQEKATAEFTNP